MSTESVSEILLSLAGEKLSLLNEYYSVLYRYTEQNNLAADDIISLSNQMQDYMDRIQKNDRLYADAATKLGILPSQKASKEPIAHPPAYVGQSRLSALLEDQKVLARSIAALVDKAYEKSARLSQDCRAGLRGVQQQRWILTQFAERPLEPGSLLNYSETLHTRSKEK